MSIFTNTLTRKEMHKTKATRRTIQKARLQIIDDIRKKFIEKGNSVVICESGLARCTCLLLSLGALSSNSLPFKSFTQFSSLPMHSSKFLVRISPHFFKCGNHSLHPCVCLQHIYSSHLVFACQLP